MKKHNFIYLFVGLLLMLGIEPFLRGSERSGPMIQIAFTAMMGVGVFSLTNDPRVFRLAVALAGVGVASSLGYYWTDSTLIRIVDLAAILGFLLLAIGVTLRNVVLEPGAITINRIMGALCMYLALGITWVILFEFVVLAEPGAFKYAGLKVGDPLEYLVYYSFVTLTTLGFGDVSPIHPVAKTLSYLEAVIGQLFIAVLIAGLVNRRRGAPG